ncbi:hypothetical protein D4T97_001760 [Siminovitchia acidinfaciens]|uniref:Uncharacterized protein n=1 Tax=Siminovitchia acidinfaciens TaxID=2321395 RepID=A0A429Y787_9BACI|nr:hypothetical protein D4T97_001760 [Siminovitchia acidinfaciens]
MLINLDFGISRFIEHVFITHLISCRPLLKASSIAIVEYLKNSNHLTLGLNTPQSSVRFVPYNYLGIKKGQSKKGVIYRRTINRKGLRKPLSQWVLLMISDRAPCHFDEDYIHSGREVLWKAYASDPIMQKEAIGSAGDSVYKTVAGLVSCLPKKSRRMIEKSPEKVMHPKS